MAAGSEIRRGRHDDNAGILAMYPDAFPDEDLVPLVRALLDEPAVAISLVVTIDDRIIGHVIFTVCRVENSENPVALLGPLGVASAHQRHGIGKDLVTAGLREMKAMGIARVLVLGDPGYYSRYGFAAETGITPPYPLPDEWAGAWQSLSIGDNEPPAGKLLVPQPWQDRALWAP